MTRQEARHLGQMNCLFLGDFVVAEMGNGEIDWFPAGQPPHLKGEVDRDAVIVERWAYLYEQGWQLVPLPERTEVMA